MSDHLAIFNVFMLTTLGRGVGYPHFPEEALKHRKMEGQIFKKFRSRKMQIGTYWDIPL